MGRGVFASQKIKKGEMILIEKALAIGASKTVDIENAGNAHNLIVLDHSYVNLVKHLTDLTHINNYNTLRLSYLYYGNNNDMQLPPISIFGS